MRDMNRLMKSLAGAGHPARVIQGRDGAKVLVLPHGGRVIGLFAPGTSRNFLWTNPALGAAKSARAFFRADAWCNSGGDRTWLAPEADFFLPNHPQSTLYFQPRQFDPGHYHCVREGDAIRLENDLTLHSYRTGEDLELKIVKRVEPAANPLANLPGFAGAGALRFAGYALRSALELCGGGVRTAVGLWHLLQLPHGGEMLIPTRARCEPKIYFGAIPRGDLAAEDGLVRWTLRIPGEHKIGVRASAATGRVGYLKGADAEWTLVVRAFEVDPRGLYCDFPWDNPADTGYAVQACNVSNAALGHFSELEYHVPAIGGATGLTRCEDVSQVWAFRGPRAAVRHAATILLGKEVL
jgi:hypothetical protein